MATGSAVKSQMKEATTFHISSHSVDEVVKVIDTILGMMADDVREDLKKKKTATVDILEGLSTPVPNSKVYKIPKSPLVREFKFYMGEGYRVSKEAGVWLEEYINNYVYDLASIASFIVEDDGRRTIKVDDIIMAHRTMLIRKCY